MKQREQLKEETERLQEEAVKMRAGQAIAKKEKWSKSKDKAIHAKKCQSQTGSDQGRLRWRNYKQS